MVAEHRALFMRGDLDDLQKAAVRSEYWGASYAAMAADAPAPKAPPRAYPPSGQMRALGTFMIEEGSLGGPRQLNAGEVDDAASLIYRAFPHLFRPVTIEERG